MVTICFLKFEVTRRSIFSTYSEMAFHGGCDGPLWFINRFMAWSAFVTYLPAVAPAAMVLFEVDAAFDILSDIYERLYAPCARFVAQTASLGIALEVRLGPDVWATWRLPATTTEAFAKSIFENMAQFAAGESYSGATCCFRVSDGSIAITHKSTGGCRIAYSPDSGAGGYTAQLTNNETREVLAACARLLAR